MSGKGHIIDCDANPFVPKDWEVEEHQKQGQLQWDPNKVLLYLCDEQRSDYIQGHELHKKLEGEPVLNACVLDYLLEHPELIPDEWKGKQVYFWGTIYRCPGGYLCVRCMGCRNNEWIWGARHLDGGWYASRPAALRK